MVLNCGPIPGHYPCAFGQSLPPTAAGRRLRPFLERSQRRLLRNGNTALDDRQCSDRAALCVAEGIRRRGECYTPERFGKRVPEMHAHQP